MIERSRVRVLTLVLDTRVSSAGECSSPGSSFSADTYFGIRCTSVLPQAHLEDPGDSAKSVGGGLQLNSQAPWIYVWLCMK